MTKELDEATEYLCVYLAKFNGGLDYHKLPEYRQQTYLNMAEEILSELKVAGTSVKELLEK